MKNLYIVRSKILFEIQYRFNNEFLIYRSEKLIEYRIKIKKKEEIIMSSKEKVNVKTEKDLHEHKETWVEKLLSEQNSPFPFYQDLDKLLESSPTLEDLFWQPVRRFLIQSH